MYKNDKFTPYAMPSEEVLKLLETSLQGLAQKEIERRRKADGPNALPRERSFGVLFLFLKQLANPIVYILVAAATASILTGHANDAFIISIAVAASVVVGFFQEYKANAALESLDTLIKHNARVVREGTERIIAAEELVVGDIILTGAGDTVPADARVIEHANAEVMEAVLTGESVASAKHGDVLDAATPLADRENMVYMGTILTRGRLKAVVCAIGHGTAIGEIASLVKTTADAPSPLQKELARFGKTLVLGLLALNALLFVIGIATGKPLLEMFLVTVATMVAAIPEGLLPAITVVLAIGMQRIIAARGLVRRMAAAETLGSVSVICTDKTGTLTEGSMRALHVFTADEQCDLELGGRTTLSGGCAATLRTGVMVNNSVLENPDDTPERWRISGDFTEQALARAGARFGIIRRNEEKAEPRIAEIPLDSSYKYMATLHPLAMPVAGNLTHIIHMKGAPERILQRSTHIRVEQNSRTISEEDRSRMLARYQEEAAKGRRVIAVAEKRVSFTSGKPALAHEDLTGLTFLGLIVLEDPLRKDVKDAFTVAREAGIRIIVITGDHKATARSLMGDLGMAPEEDRILEGGDLDGMSDEDLSERIRTTDLFARTEPKHKYRIVQSLQAQGQVVAMTGDGVNDAPALKTADIGIAVGVGTDVAKEASDLILLDNSFSTIVEAVHRGRIIFNTIRKVVVYLITSSFSEMALVAGAILLGLPLPLLVGQILWINLVTDIAPAMALAFDDLDEGVMNEKPRPSGESILSSSVHKLIWWHVAIMDLTLFMIYYGVLRYTGDIAYTRTLMFVCLGLSTVLYVFSVRGYRTPVWRLPLWGNRYLVGAACIGVAFLFLSVKVPGLRQLLQTVPLSASAWALVFLYGVFIVGVYEMGKHLFLRKK